MKIKYLIAFLVLILLSACVPQAQETPPTPVPTPIVPQKPVYTVQRGRVSRVLELRGRVSAIRQQELFFRTSGTVDSVLVSRGESVSAGQVLAHLSEREKFEAAVTDARLDVVKVQRELDKLFAESGLRSAEALVDLHKAQDELAKARRELATLGKVRASNLTIAEAETHYVLMNSQLEEARRWWENVQHRDPTDMERMQALANLTGIQRSRDQALATLNWYKGHSSPEEISAAEAKLALAEAKLKEAERKYERIKDGPDPYDVSLAEATLARAEGALKKAEAELESLEIIAPYDGVVLSVALSPGMQVTAFKAVLTVVDPQGLEITLLPSSAELSELSAGQAAVVRLANRPGQEYPGQVRSVPLTSGSTAAGQASDQSVRVSLEDKDMLLTMGEIATVTIALEERDSVLWLSPAALRTFQGRDFVIIQDGEIQRRVDIRLGLKSQERVEILEGLADGQSVLGP
jgi:HlyD family secretion protein